MRPLRLLIIWQALLLCCIGVSAYSSFAGLLLSPGFEPPNSAWELSTSAFIKGAGANYPAAYDGSYKLKLEVNTGLLGSMSFAKQSLLAAGQQEWTFTGHMLNYDGAPMKQGSYGLLEIVFTGASFGEQRFSSTNCVPDLPDKWSFSAVTAVAPAGTEQVTFYVKLMQGEPVDPGSSAIWWDVMDATVLEPVPELASTGWVAVLIVGLAIGGQQLRSRRAARAKVPVSL